ncbi:valine-pyruvate aminotransferase apoenzyme [Rubritalea squalenifaciens DSM 18772]|uniref:Valine-pyruvate aminotransferase apoenzyme n=1 Tax=Rubritalea squalenifaciens DSM 18772 TaxID=1123071 RepID=A0A1M6IPL7_9BACT|nr:valine--pyruvate transaminase [Rubritalea squalenifaciens]SHJ36396.1 valine-pyruvate aminotransferase apoenzyme [Rubritalea squalenifaciens DSM 18772]
MVDYSLFGKRLCGGSGIEELMDDLGHALATGGPDTKMLGGGQPGSIPEMNAIWRERLQEILDEPGAMEKVLCNYDPPRGNPKFLSSVAQMFREKFGWNITEKNLAITPGGQSAFFFIFNALAGRFEDGRRKKILLPLVPEYIGYANQSVGADFFKAYKPKIEKLGDHQFKYRVDFDALEVTEEISAICVSRPTNPSGNVLTDNEMAKLAKLAKENGVPLIIDNAYGAPFPNIFFADANPLFDDNTILTLSLSKIGLPGTRTGIVIAPEEIASAIASMSAIVDLANNNVGQAIMEPLVRSGKILELSNEVVRPFYLEKSKQAQGWVSEFFEDTLPYRYHVSEGALFLWMWFEDMPITARELYERLKARNVLVVPGNYFFFGLGDDEWRHRRECIRVTYTMDEGTVRDGIRIIAEEVQKAYVEKA